MKLWPALLTLFTAASAAAYTTTKDVTYDVVNGVSLKLDVFTPSTPSQKPAPAVLFIHGGCFNAGSKNDIPAEVKALADEGFVVASIGYRLSTVAKYPAAVSDVQMAVRFLRREHQRFGIDAQKISTLGLSAGGYLAAVLGLRQLPARNGRIDQYSGRVQKVADWYGRTDFTLAQSEGFDCAVDFLGKPRNLWNMHRFAEASLPRYVTSQAARFLIIHGTEDKQVDPIHSRLLHDALIEQGQESSLLWVRGAGHGFFGNPGWERTKEFLRSP